MNDSSEHHYSNGAVEICRVCRSEGTPDQPLFYPCLCSGSIKYIHQDCLIEWLKHSRKKHCELCKHPFTFSPVYTEQMPQTIPIHVLLWGLVKKVFFGLRILFSLLFSAVLWFIAVPLITAQIFRYYFGWNLHEILHSALAIHELNDHFLETSLLFGFDIIQGFIMTGFSVFLILAMLLVREFLMMIGYNPNDTTANDPVNTTTNTVDNNQTDSIASSNTDDSDLFSSETSTTLPPNSSSLRSPLSPTAPLVSPLSPTRRHSEFRTTGGTNPIPPGSPGGNYWVEQAHPKEFRNYMKRRDLQRSLMESEQNHRPIDPETYLNENDSDSNFTNYPNNQHQKQQAEGHVSNISATSTLRSRFTTATTTTNYTNATNSSSRESFRCRICSSNTCTSREHVIQASQMRNTLMAQRNQAILQRQEEAQASANNQTEATQTRPNPATNTTNNNDLGGWNLDAAESISFPEFFGFTLDGTPLLQLLQNSAIVIGLNALFMHIFLFVPYITGKTVSNKAILTFVLSHSTHLVEYTKFTWKYVALFAVEKDSFAEFGRNVVIGYSILCFACSLYLKFTKGLRDTFHRTIGPILGFLCVFIKLLTLLFVEMVLFPLACGFMVDYVCLGLFPESTTFYSRLVMAKNLPISSLTIHWALGAFFMLNFASFVTFSRSFLRPGLLFFLRNPQDPDSNPIKEMVERSFLDQIYRLAISLLFYGVLIYSSVGVSVKIISIPFISQCIFPLHFKFHEPLLEIPLDLLFHLLLRSLLTSFSPLKLFKTCYISLQKSLFRLLNLSSYFVGGGRFLAEEHFPKGGNWVAVPDFDRMYSRSRLREIRSRVITPVEVSKLKILFDRQNQPVMDTSTTTNQSSSTAKSDWTVVFRPNYFKLKCLLVLAATLICLQVFLLAISIGPLVTGRFLVKLAQVSVNKSHQKIHEIYSWHIGAFGLFFLIKFVEFLAFPIKKSRRSSRTPEDTTTTTSILQKIGILLNSGLKMVALAFFMLALWPLQVGLFFSLLINPVLMDNHDLLGNILSNTQSLTLQLPIIFFGTCWSIGFPILRLLYSIRSHLPLPRSTISYLRTHRSFDQVELKQFFKLVALPVTLMFTLTIVLPPALCLIFVPLYSAGSFESVLKYQNSSHLLALITYLSLKTVKAAVTNLTRIVSGIRDETYLVGRRLHNLENRGTNTPTTTNTNNNNNMSPLI